MLNDGGPKLKRRQLYNEEVYSVLIYGAPLGAQADSSPKKKCITSAFRIKFVLTCLHMKYRRLIKDKVKNGTLDASQTLRFELNYYLTQAFTRHGCFGSCLRRAGKKAIP